MITLETLKEANKDLDSIPVKGKKYVQVTTRVKAFRSICPDGKIETDVIALEDGEITIKATISDETGKVLSTGIAHEKESDSFINKTSYVENCETSAVGRALGFLGIGSDESMASAEELANALLNQEKSKEFISEKEQKVLVNLIKKKGLDVENVLNGTPLDKVTVGMYTDAVKRLNKLKEAVNDNRKTE